MDKSKQYSNTSKTLPAASIIEVIVASIIFLTIFTISLLTITQLTTRNTKINYVQIIEDIHAASHKYLQIGDCTEEYPWGKMAITTEFYNHHQEIRLITIRSSVGVREITFKFLAQNETDNTSIFNSRDIDRNDFGLHSIADSF